MVPVRSELLAPLLAHVIPPAHPQCGLQTHAAAIAMSARHWLVHLCGRASPRALAREAAVGTTDAAA
eukprot:2950406-Pyramimonas_sp.AAC.1